MQVAAGGRFAPGNSIGTVRVDGPVRFAADSIYEVVVNAAGQSDLIAATGAASLAGTVEVLAEAGTYQPFTNYTILTAQGGITGTFGKVTSNLAFLTPTLSYTANAVNLELMRNDIDFADAATTLNQIATANALEDLGGSSTLYRRIAVLSETGAQQAYDALSGEVHASVPSAMINESRHIGSAMLEAGRETQPGFAPGRRQWEAGESRRPEATASTTWTPITRVSWAA